MHFHKQEAARGLAPEEARSTTLPTLLTQVEPHPPDRSQVTDGKACLTSEVHDPRKAAAACMTDHECPTVQHTGHTDQGPNIQVPCCRTDVTTYPCVESSWSPCKRPQRKRCHGQSQRASLLEPDPLVMGDQKRLVQPRGRPLETYPHPW